jgi:4-hydroxythreonine-4-phosphate dehydrogenase
MSARRPLLAVSMGDPAGIGPQITLAAAARATVRRCCRIVVYGDQGVLEGARRLLGESRSQPTAIERVEALTALRFSGTHPKPSRGCGEGAFRYLDAAARAVWSGACDALVTAPISKLWLYRAGHEYDGHTGYLSELTGAQATMMLAGRRLRVVLVTTHIAISEVPRALTVDGVCTAARTAHEHLREYHGLKRPRLVLAALNPHAGEGGLFGDEEARLLEPAARRLRRSGVCIEGPLPADTLFAAAAAGNYDAVLCMYHDQALIPLKLLEFGKAVNISMGLPFVRTSPDHGTAYDVVASGEARADSMAQALLLAAEMVRARGGRKEA